MPQQQQQQQQHSLQLRRTVSSISCPDLSRLGAHPSLRQPAAKPLSLANRVTSLILTPFEPRDSHGTSRLQRVAHDRKLKKLHVQEEKAMDAVPRQPVERSKFCAFVHERRKKKILFKGEYLVIKKSVNTAMTRHDVASSADVADRNQYPEVLPYDHNRVILSKLPDQPSHSTYTNASHIEGLAGALPRRPYVVTQSVKCKPAVSEFWRMVWELKSNCIVMLTKVFDFMRVMCLQYWPVSRGTYGEFDVEMLETKTYCHFVVRAMRIRRGSETRTVHQFHFTEWELDSFPYISAFIEFRRRVRQYVRDHPSDAPLVVHCSNGAGRSGVFVAVDACLQQLAETNHLDVHAFCKQLNAQRMGLIESVEQYTFIYDVLCEAIECPAEPQSLDCLERRSDMYKSKHDRELMEKQDTDEYKTLNKLTPSLSVGDCAGGHRIENRGKNRDVMVVPPDHSRPYLHTLHGESKDYTYINAVLIDGFHRKQEWIVTEWPKPATIDSFWALVFDHSCHTVVNLTNQARQKTYPKFIHDKGKQVYGPFVVEVMNYQSYPSMTSHTVKVMKRRSRESMDSLLRPGNDKGDPSHHKLASAMGIPVRKDRSQAALSPQQMQISEIMSNSAAASSSDDFRICCLVSVKVWPIQNKVPISTSGLVDVMKLVRSWRKRAPDRPETKPTIVLSHNGVSRVGVFIGANYCIDQMDSDREVDVFHAVKLIRINRPQIIDTKEEYKYLWDLMLHWYVMNPEYRQRHNAAVAAAAAAADGAVATGTGAAASAIGNHA